MTSFRFPHDHGNIPEGVQESLSSLGDSDFDVVASLFKALSDSTRVKIFWLLCHCEECVVNIAALLGISSPAASHHLRILRDQKLVASHREGKEVYYRASDTEQAKLLHSMIEDAIEVSCPKN